MEVTVLQYFFLKCTETKDLHGLTMLKNYSKINLAVVQNIL